MTASYRLNEPSITALYERLANGAGPLTLDAALAAVAADVADIDQASDLAPIPAEHIFDFMPSPSHLVAFPAIGLADVTSLLEEDTGSSLTGMHTIGIVAFAAHADQRRLAWQLRRVVQAAFAVALTGRSLENDGGLTRPGAPGRIEWGPTLASTDGTPKTWMSFAQLTVECRREEI